MDTRPKPYIKDKIKFALSKPIRNGIVFLYPKLAPFAAKRALPGPGLIINAIEKLTIGNHKSNITQPFFVKSLNRNKETLLKRDYFFW